MNDKNIERQEQEQAELSELSAALFEFMKPILKLLLSYRITYPAIDAAIKEALVELAVESGTPRGEAEDGDPVRSIPFAHIAAKSGLSVHHIRQVMGKVQDRLEENKEREFEQSQLSPEGKLLEIWASHPAFVDDDGEPKVLDVRGAVRATFQRLVSIALSNASYERLLDSLVSAGNVETFNDDEGVLCARMLNPQFQPNTKDRARSLQVVARCMRHLMQTAEFNLCHAEELGEKKRLQFEVWTARLNSDEDIARFREETRGVSKKLVDLTAEELTRLEDELALGPQTAGSVHAGVGLYYFEDRDYREFGSDN
ncbi:MAG: DUF6502 family protein [Pseudomonadota bacterium]